jgi:hypothetical protein
MRKMYLVLLGLLAVLCLCYCVHANSQYITIYDDLDVYQKRENFPAGWSLLCSEVTESDYVDYSSNGGDMTHVSGEFQTIGRSWYRFNTTYLPDNAIVLNASLFTTCSNSNQSTVIVVESTMDWSHYTETSQFGSLNKNKPYSDESEIHQSSINEIELTDISFINVSDYSDICIIDYYYDYLCNEPSGRDTFLNKVRYNEHSKYLERPQLFIEYEIEECPSCNNTNITLYENIINATGSHESKYNSSTGWKVWANYTGNTSIGSCEGIVWINFTDSNLTFNVSVDKSDDSNTSSYTINEDNWLYLSALSLSPELTLITLLGMFFYFAEKRKSFVLYMLTSLIALPAGIYFLGWEVELTSKLIGLAIFMFSIYCAGIALAYGLRGQESGK